MASPTPRFTARADVLDGGFIPYSRQDDAQKAITDAWRSTTPLFREAGIAEVDVPENVFLPLLEDKVLGPKKRMPRFNQYNGSCVGVSGALARMIAMLGDIALRGDNESPEAIFPFATWGIGRQKAGMNRRGDGSFGGAQSWASTNWGWLPVSHPKLPEFQMIRNFWLGYSSAVELYWSYPGQWPTPERDLRPDANQYETEEEYRADTTDEVDQALAQCHGVTLAGLWGCRSMRVEDNFLIAPRWDATWSHQETVFAKVKHPRHGKIYGIQNQWPGVHPPCPTLQQWGIEGAYWIPEKLFAEVLRSGDTEVRVIARTKGIPVKELSYDGNLGIGT